MAAGSRITLGLAVLVGLLFVAVPAYAADPSISVDSITFTPGGADVRQTITYHDLPDHTSVHYEISRDWGGFALSQPNGTACSVPVGYSGDCTELSGSGVLYATFGRADASFSGNDVGNVTVSVASLSLQATGTVTAAPKADVYVSFVATAGGAEIAVMSKGPSVSRTETLRITGFQQIVNVPTGTCELDGLGVVCYLRELAPPVSAPECGMLPTGRYETCYDFALTLAPGSLTPLTATVSGAVPDPNQSNNSQALFGNAAGNPPPVPGGGSGGTGRSGGGSGGGSAAGEVRPSFAVNGPTSGPGASSPADAPASGDQAGGGLAVGGSGVDTRPLALTLAVAVAGFVVGAGLGGTGLLVALRRFRLRPVSPPGYPPPPVMVSSPPDGTPVRVAPGPESTEESQ